MAVPRILDRLLRLLAAAALTACTLGLGVLGMYVTTAPELLSRLVEPLCLLFLPGLAATLLVSNAHDFEPRTVVYASAVFYLCLYALLLRPRSARSLSSPTESGVPHDHDASHRRYRGRER